MVADVEQAVTTACAFFCGLGFITLYISSKPVTLGGVLMTLLLSGASSQVALALRPLGSRAFPVPVYANGGTDTLGTDSAGGGEQGPVADVLQMMRYASAHAWEAMAGRMGEMVDSREV